MRYCVFLLLSLYNIFSEIRLGKLNAKKKMLLSWFNFSCPILDLFPILTTESMNLFHVETLETFETLIHFH